MRSANSAVARFGDEEVHVVHLHGVDAVVADETPRRRRSMRAGDLREPAAVRHRDDRAEAARERTAERRVVRDRPPPEVGRVDVVAPSSTRSYGRSGSSSSGVSGAGRVVDDPAVRRLPRQAADAPRRERPPHAARRAAAAAAARPAIGSTKSTNGDREHRVGVLRREVAAPDDRHVGQRACAPPGRRRPPASAAAPASRSRRADEARRPERATGARRSRPRDRATTLPSTSVHWIARPRARRRATSPTAAAAACPASSTAGCRGRSSGHPHAERGRRASEPQPRQLPAQPPASGPRDGDELAAQAERLRRAWSSSSNVRKPTPGRTASSTPYSSRKRRSWSRHHRLPVARRGEHRRVHDGERPAGVEHAPRFGQRGRRDRARSAASRRTRRDRTAPARTAARRSRPAPP